MKLCWSTLWTSYQILMQYVRWSEGMRQQQQYHPHPHHPQPQQYLWSLHSRIFSLHSSISSIQLVSPIHYLSNRPNSLHYWHLKQQQQSLQQLGMLTFPADVRPVSAGVASGSGRTVHLRVNPSGLAPLPSISTRDLTTSAALLDPNVTLASLWIYSQQCLEHLPRLSSLKISHFIKHTLPSSQAHPSPLVWDSILYYMLDITREH